ncbi:MAG TPA: hypothetical protein PKD18_13835 [Saprospiraceae bacterium]|nr:hypothetical protein [Saprospiraceae bacterium]
MLHIDSLEKVSDSNLIGKFKDKFHPININIPEVKVSKIYLDSTSSLKAFEYSIASGDLHFGIGEFAGNDKMNFINFYDQLDVEIACSQKPSFSIFYKVDGGDTMYYNQYLQEFKIVNR